MNPLLFHAIPMGAGFGLMAAAGYISRFQKKKRWWLKSHRSLGLAGAIVLIPGAIAAVVLVALGGEEHFESPHTWLGALTITLSWAAVTLGLLVFRMREQAARLRVYHRWIGRLALAAALVTVLTGLRLAEVL